MTEVKQPSASQISKLISWNDSNVNQYNSTNEGDISIFENGSAKCCDSYSIDTSSEDGTLTTAEYVADQYADYENVKDLAALDIDLAQSLINNGYEAAGNGLYALDHGNDNIEYVRAIQSADGDVKILHTTASGNTNKRLEVHDHSDKAFTSAFAGLTRVSLDKESSLSNYSSPYPAAYEKLEDSGYTKDGTHDGLYKRVNSDGTIDYARYLVDENGNIYMKNSRQYNDGKVTQQLYSLSNYTK